MEKRSVKKYFITNLTPFVLLIIYSGFINAQALPFIQGLGSGGIPITTNSSADWGGGSCTSTHLICYSSTGCSSTTSDTPQWTSGTISLLSNKTYHLNTNNMQQAVALRCGDSGSFSAKIYCYFGAKAATSTCMNFTCTTGACTYSAGAAVMYNIT